MKLIAAKGFTLLTEVLVMLEKAMDQPDVLHGELLQFGVNSLDGKSFKDDHGILVVASPKGPGAVRHAVFFCPDYDAVGDLTPLKVAVGHQSGKQNAKFVKLATYTNYDMAVADMVDYLVKSVQSAKGDKQ